jgi:ribosomal protein S27E
LPDVVIYIVTIIAVWVISALVSLGVAPRGRQAEFFALTLLILGPLGVGFAAVAVPRDPEIPGRIRIVCPRCVAAQYVGTGVHEFGCWRCDQRIAVDDWGRPSVTSNTAASKPRVTDTATPTGKATKVKCFNCQHIQQVPVGASSFDCEKCSAKLKRTKTS